MSLLQKSTSIIKFSSLFGLTTGFSIGLWLNMNTMIKYKNGNRITNIKLLPSCFIIGSFMSVITPITICLTPFGIINCIFNLSFIDKKYDETIENIKNKYEITLDRYHQYGSSNTKYDYPSHIRINIEKKELA